MSGERVVTIEVDGHALVGIVHEPASSAADIGVVVVVGGPQYRVGSHRQFVLLARDLCAAGVPVLRFDYSGMGDSEGEVRTFEQVSGDIAAAIDALMLQTPAVRRVVLWGLCDGASAALMYAPSDRRVAGLVLLNPWVRSDAGLARSQLWTYYPRRLVSADFWRKAARRPRALIESAIGLVGTLRRSRQARTDPEPPPGVTESDRHFLDRMIRAVEQFEAPVRVLLSGNDITAGEFKAIQVSDRRWRKAFGRRSVSTVELPDANHTFSSANWRNWVSVKSLEFIRAL